VKIPYGLQQSILDVAHPGIQFRLVTLPSMRVLTRQILQELPPFECLYDPSFVLRLLSSMEQQ
jgi:hypothetical protein